MWEHALVAFNTATESSNRMHDDAVARSYGFGGGLVPGVDVWAYLTRPCVDRWGTTFLTEGSMTVRFVRPVYDGERVVARLTEDGELTLLGPDGAQRATGSAALGALAPTRPVGRAPRPASPPPASSAVLAPGTTLGTLEFTYDRRRAAVYLDDVRETSTMYDHGAIAHPGFLARQANYVLSRNVVLGPWIHVETAATHHGVVRDGDRVEVRGAVVDERERSGHRFVELAVEIRGAGAIVWTARHTAIWRPRPTGPAPTG